MVFCTLYDSNYLDKGIVMYYSLYKQTQDFNLYVLAMDKKCYEILNIYHFPNQILISVDEFVKETGLETIKKTRPKGEFCWTCTPYLIDYVLSKYKEKICTYIDSDLFFYSNPQVLIDEMKDKTVQITEHRFSHSFYGRMTQKESGTYCVQFNTFKNTPDAIELLQWWKTRCYESCSNIDLKKNKVFGDQGYLETWGQKENVSVLEHLGGGVAPWNLCQYQLIKQEDNQVVLQEKKTGIIFPLIFYHFHNIKYRDRYNVDFTLYEVWNVDKKLIDVLYNTYLIELNNVKNELIVHFGFLPLIYSHPGIKERVERVDRKTDRILNIRVLFSMQLLQRIYMKFIRKKERKYSYLHKKNIKEIIA